MTRFDIHSPDCDTQDTHPGITACKPCNCWVGRIATLEAQLAAAQRTARVGANLTEAQLAAVTKERDIALKIKASVTELADKEVAALTAERDAVTRCNCPQCQPVTGDCPAATELTDMEAQLAAVTAERDMLIEMNKRLMVAYDAVTYFGTAILIGFITWLVCAVFWEAIR